MSGPACADGVVGAGLRPHVPTAGHVPLLSARPLPVRHHRRRLAVGNPLYSRLFAYFISDAAPMKVPGAQFLASAVFLLAAFGVSLTLV